LPELPEAKAKRIGHEYKLPGDDVAIIISEKALADYFEKVISELREKITSDEFSIDEGKAIKLATNYIITELRKHLAEHGHGIEDIEITSENYAEFICFVASGKINSSAAQTVLLEMYKTGGDPSQIIEEKNLSQVSNEAELESITEKVLKDNLQSVGDYKKGKENAMKFLIGQVMKETKGKANPQIVQEILKKKLQ
jgi:aspartyl-tRNA(Asn)/glutamyl-tRNA(Gln) amidotransferase subunit B